ncbi:MAG: hypothetical protein H3C68_05700 [Deltaproteobacteria bacterium]|nr:hypothetical protein [Deltaproteobacteria bacterium]MBZ0220222.1 hypothetical protein [Deltaproteobacteria bacterium]
MPRRLGIRTPGKGPGMAGADSPAPVFKSLAPETREDCPEPAHPNSIG